MSSLSAAVYGYINATKPFPDTRNSVSVDWSVQENAGKQKRKHSRSHAVQTMGASVYTFIEYREYDCYWSFGEINLPRDIEFLCAIAWGDGGITDEMPYPPRGAFPADASYEARESFL